MLQEQSGHQIDNQTVKVRRFVAFGDMCGVECAFGVAAAGAGSLWALSIGVLAVIVSFMAETKHVVDSRLLRPGRPVGFGTRRIR